MKFYFATPVWGENHIQLFVDVGLPSMLAPGNLPSLSDRANCKFFVYTRPEDEALLRNAPSFKRLLGIMPVEILLLESPFTTDAWTTMSRCHAHAMRRADEDDAAAVFPPPDCIWGNGSFRRMEELASSGMSCIHIAAIRLDRDTFIKDVGAWRSDNEIEIPNRALVALGLKHLHKIAYQHFWDEYDGLMPANIYWSVPGEGLVVHCLHLHPLMVRSQVKFVDFKGTIDDDLVLNACPDFSRHYVVPDSDEMVTFEISGPTRSIGEAHPKATLDFVAGWAEAHANKLHRKLLLKGIRIHSTAATESAWDPVEKKANRIVKAIHKINRSPTILCWIYPSVLNARRGILLNSPAGGLTGIAITLTIIDWTINAQRNAQRAIRQFLKITRVLPRDAEYFVARAQKHLKVGDASNGLALLQSALQLTPNDAGILSLCIMTRMALGDFMGALNDANTALGLAPADINLVVQRAEAHRAIGNWRAALEDYDTAIAASPKELPYYRQRALVLQEIPPQRSGAPLQQSKFASGTPIFRQTASMILKEHKYCRITGNVEIIGHQTVLLTIDEALALIASEGIQIRRELFLETDSSTAGPAVVQYITARSFFSMFSDAKVSASNSYQDVEIVHDLNADLPKKDERLADFIFDGSCLGNLFDPGTAIKSVSKRLKPHGRVMHLAHGSPIQKGLLCYSPKWFFDFYAINNYSDCQNFVCTFSSSQQNDWEVFRWHPYYLEDGQLKESSSSIFIGDFLNLVIAEKGGASTDSRVPIYRHDRDLQGNRSEHTNVSMYQRYSIRGRKFNFTAKSRRLVAPSSVPRHSGFRGLVLLVFNYFGITIRRGGPFFYRIESFSESLRLLRNPELTRLGTLLR